MPYRSEKINIQNTIWDRRQKLSEDQKEYMRYLREEYGLSYNQLAKQFGVSKRTAIFVCRPELYAKAQDQFKERRKDGRYKPTKEEWAETMRDHRHYKQKLYLEEKIGYLNNEDMDEQLKELLEQYGYEYLSEKNPDACPYSMDELDELTNYSALQAIMRAFYGYRYNPYWDGNESHREEFNPNDEYFSFNGYANLVSITSWALPQWVLDHIDDEDDFIEWCKKQGYIDEEE